MRTVHKATDGWPLTAAPTCAMEEANNGTESYIYEENERGEIGEAIAAGRCIEKETDSLAADPHAWLGNGTEPEPRKARRLLQRGSNARIT
ncbi:hypothetical protein HPB50_015762 [Hyalomma asiaticum]|uniref:Uncharacterized protein n=1 Tax=Hyalomma asiaticum TaxID=266040 RepID=A0ACB7SZ39_HYAAI|nr:hypothetical protein HPB50_015762 [Hyalomma asiaticum]